MRDLTLPCSDQPCDLPAWCRTVCARHWHLRKKQGTLVELPRARRAHGEGSVDGRGYRLFWIDGKQVGEHRLVAERMLGRKLVDGENVHHLNGEKADNRPENLEIWVKSQPCGQRVTDLAAWLVEYHREAVINALLATIGAGYTLRVMRDVTQPEGQATCRTPQSP